jgi:hypothetical protein
LYKASSVSSIVSKGKSGTPTHEDKPARKKITNKYLAILVIIKSENEEDKPFSSMGCSFYESEQKGYIQPFPHSLYRNLLSHS